MGIVSALTAAFYKEATPKKRSYAEQQHDRAMSVVKRFARGGVAMQSGRILTEERFNSELAALKKKVESKKCDS